MWTVRDIKEFWEEFFSPEGRFRVVRVTKDYTSDMVKHLITEFSPPFAGYTESVPELTYWELECDSVRLAAQGKMLFIIVNLLDEDFSDEKVAEDIYEFQRHMFNWVLRFKNIQFRVIIPEGVSWSYIGHNDLRAEHIEFYVCLEGCAEK